MKGFCWRLMVLQYVFVDLSAGWCRAVLIGIHSAAHKKTSSCTKFYYRNNSWVA